MLLMEIEICMSVIMKNHKIGFGMVHTDPRAYCQLPPHKFGSSIKICVSAIMKNHTVKNTFECEMWNYKKKSGRVGV